jgi:predicted RecA/RadA family phage recombinase
MENFVQPGDSLTFTAPSGGVVSGVAYLIGTIVVVATVTAAQGESFVGKATGVFLLDKTTSEAWAEGAKVYLNNSTHKLTTTSGGNTLVGVAYHAALAAATTGYARLDGVTR